MKSIKFIKNSFFLYLFEEKSFLKIANYTSLKTTMFTLILINFLLIFFANFIKFNFSWSNTFTEILIILLQTGISFLIMFFLFMIVSGFYHIIYRYFGANAKFKKMVIIINSINIVAIILFLINIFIIVILKKFEIPIIYSKTIFIIFTIALIIWYLIVNVKYIAKIQRVSTIKSYYIFGLIPTIILLIIALIIIKSFIFAKFAL